MKLFVDIGNSHIKFVNFDGQYGDVCKIKYEKHILGNPLSNSDITSLAAPDEIICINVAGYNIKRQLIDQCLSIWDLNPEFIKVCQSDFGVTNSYKDIDQLGVDRWMAMIAAWNIVHKKVMVVDIGSAMTIDLIDDDGIHLGGYIVPGNYLMANALFKDTNIQSDTDHSNLSLQPGKSTQECIVNGAARSLTSMIMDIYHSINENQQNLYQCVITGGGANNIIEHLKIPLLYEPMLVFEGMRLTRRYS